jgi:hypothetical protein
MVAVITLLLLGPSVAFAAVYALGGMSLFTGETEVAQPAAPVQAVAEAERRPIASSQSLDPPPPLKPLSAPREEPAPPAQTVLNIQPAPSVAPQPEATPAPAPVAPAPEPQITPPPPAPAPQSFAPLPAPAPAPEEPAYEENRTATPSPLAPEAEEAPAAPAPTIDPFEGPTPQQRQQAGPGPTESEARASARFLSQLKEPDRGDADSASGGQVAALPREERRKDTFADCPSCPVMSTTPADVPGDANTALSLSEITVGEWNACVRDGVCAPYPRGAALETPVTGISRRNATAYADWLSARTGESYRIVVTPPQPRAQAQPARGDCQPDNRNGVTGFEWLEDDRPRTPCPPAATANGEDRPAGFRVSRKLRRQG